MLSHANAFTFLDWCDQTFGLGADDRFASHAPFHFDLSVFDLYASCRAGGDAGPDRRGARQGPGAARARSWPSGGSSVWYSAPSILALLARVRRARPPGLPRPPARPVRGRGLPDRARCGGSAALWPDADALEPLRADRDERLHRVPDPRGRSPTTATTPFPIGPVCPPLRARVVDEQGRDVAAGDGRRAGHRRPRRDARLLRPARADRPRLPPRRRRRPPGIGPATSSPTTATAASPFHGRRDRMVKKRGYRIELGEIESALYRHEGVDRAAVSPGPTTTGVSIAAFVAMKPGRKGSIIAMKRHCTRLPAPLHGPRLDHVPLRPADDLDRQGRLPGPEAALGRRPTTLTG